MLFLVLFAIFLLLFVWVFRPPFPNIGRLIGFLLLLGVAAVIAYFFVVRVLHKDPDPVRLEIARRVTDNKIIDLSRFVPGLPQDLDMIHRIDADGDADDRVPLEWAVFYRYDITTAPGTPVGPFGAAVYDIDRCRPPAVLSYELAPVNYDYLGQIWAWPAVENIIKYADPLSRGLDRPEVIITGQSAGGVPTDLNIFRKVGNDPNCVDVQNWRQDHPGQIFPYAEWLRYDNVGSFRGNYQVTREGETVHVFDRNPEERSQITIRRDYRPLNGSYFQPGTQTLLDPVEFTLTFGTGRPDDIPQVYYPEKAVLAFYQSLRKGDEDLARAKSYLSAGAQTSYDIKTDTFGLYSGADSPAQARGKLAQVLVWELRYLPDREAERLHADRQVTAIVVGVNAAGEIDTAHPCQVTWRIVAALNPNALPYGCEWRLDRYQSSCPGPGEHGGLPGAGELGWVAP